MPWINIEVNTTQKRADDLVAELIDYTISVEGIEVTDFEVGK